MESWFHACWIKISVPHLCCWHLHIFCDGGEKESHILTVAELWMYSSGLEMKCLSANGIPWHCHRIKLQESVQALWKWCILYFSAMKDLWWTMHFHVKLRWVVYTVLNCCLIMLSGVSDPLTGHKLESLDTSNNAVWVSLQCFNRSGYRTEGNQQPYQRGTAKNLYRGHVALHSFV